MMPSNKKEWQHLAGSKISFDGMQLTTCYVHARVSSWLVVISWKGLKRRPWPAQSKSQNSQVTNAYVLNSQTFVWTEALQKFSRFFWTLIVVTVVSNWMTKPFVAFHSSTRPGLANEIPNTTLLSTTLCCLILQDLRKALKDICVNEQNNSHVQSQSAEYFLPCVSM